MTDATDSPSADMERAPREPEATIEVGGRRATLWLVPMIALAIVAGFVVREWWQRGPMVVVELPRATGMEAGRTKVFSRGVAIGLVERVRLDEDLEHPLVEVRLERWAAAFARTGTVYWIVTPSIGFRGVSGLETLTSGPVLEARAGETGAAASSRFLALARPPSDAGGMPGLRLTLTAPRLGSLRPGSPVTYRDVEVGEVLEAHLANDAKSAHVQIVIGERFAPLVREGTRFWSRSGFGVDLGMTGLKLRTESIESILGGGVAFATPDATKPAAAQGALFELADELDKDWLKWSPAIPLNADGAAEASTSVSPRK